MTMLTQTTYSAQHILTFDAALRDARTQLPRTADARRADRGLVLALNHHVTLYSPTMAYVTSERDPEVWYQVTRWDCDCPDSMRRLARRTDDTTPLGHYWCKHQYAVALMGLAHVNLSLKGYVPEVPEVWYPAVYQGESGCTWSGRATETEGSGWFFQFGDGEGGLYCSVKDLELWERTPEHVIQWTGEVSRFERWLQGS